MRERERGEAGRQRCRVAAVKLIKWQREKELQRQGRSREREREDGEEKGGGKWGRETVDNCKKLSQSEIKNAKTNRQRDSDKRSFKPGTDRAMCGQGTGLRGKRAE